MSRPLVPGVGAVLSADIAVPEHAREVRFYSRVLTTGDEPLWREDLMNNLGIPVIGLGEKNAEYANLPVQWMPHIQVADVGKSVQRALEMGGQELMQARGEDGVSQWAVLLDPNGAAFGLIPVVPAEAIPPLEQGVADTVGRVAWLDLTVQAAISTRDFYQQVVGWEPREVVVKDGELDYADFNMLGADGGPAAGICHARGQNTGLPPVWLIYLPVGDLAESLRRTEAEGGEVIKAHRQEDGAYIYAAVRDPVGAYVGLLPAQQS